MLAVSSAAAALAAIAAGIVLLRLGKSRSAPARSADRIELGGIKVGGSEVGAGLCCVRFELAELTAIRNLLGEQVAAGLLACLTRKIAERAALAMPAVVGDSAITLTLHGNAATQTERQISLVCASLAETTTYAGIAFNFTARSAILGPDGLWHDSASARLLDPAAYPADRPESRDLNRLELLQKFWVGLENGEVALAYQPKLDLRANTISSAEALLRWTRADGPSVNTGELIKLCEQTGTIKQLTRWTLGKAIADNEQFRAAGHDLLVFVNVSGGLLADAAFADDVLALIAQTPSRIGIEITETAVIADPKLAIANLDRFAQAGIAVAIDDFGAGLSSLEYLQRLPASELKIDQTFIAKLSSSNRNPLITRATIDLAHALEMRVTAEGVDDQLSLALLKVMGCDLAQGYLISHPLAPNKLLSFLATFSGAESLAKPLANKPAARR